MKFLSKYRIKLVLNIALAWTVIDMAMYVYRFYNTDVVISRGTQIDVTAILILRLALIFIISLIMGYLLVYKLRYLFRNLPLWVSLLLKSVILVAASFLLNFLLRFTYIWLVERHPAIDDVHTFYYKIFQTAYFFDQMLRWLVIFLLTILFIEVNEKYSPGVFFSILFGKYINPKTEKRIIMFIDLVDSTVIAEQMGHKKYFRFIRDFIYFVSLALLENDGQIYQYVGDEIVVSWRNKNSRVPRKCLRALLECKRILQQNKNYFTRLYGRVPEFRVGIHTGEVTIGEVGVAKKDLTMSGDCMNTTARLKAAGAELNQNFVVSKEFVEQSGLKDSQIVNLGMVDLKGKESAMELYGLKI